MNNGYAIYCTQRGIYFPADEKSKFNSLKEDMKKIKSWTPHEIANQFEWEIHDYKTEEEVYE